MGHQLHPCREASLAALKWGITPSPDMGSMLAPRGTPRERSDE